MALLQILPPLISQTQQNFNTATSIGFQAIQTWSALAQANSNVDYYQDINTNFQNNDFTYAGTVYQPIPNFSFNFNPKNTGCIFNMKLNIKGQGYVGIIVNSQLLREIPFNNTTFIDVNYNRIEKFVTSNNKIVLNIRSTSGPVTVAMTKNQPFLNYLQIWDINS